MNRITRRARTALFCLAIASVVGAAAANARPDTPDSIRARERAAEPTYQRALAVARADADATDAILDAIQAALDAGACPTRTLTEEAFLPVRASARFRDLIRDHARQWSISMLLPDEPGERLDVSGVVLDGAGAPIKGALVFVYHTDASGHYSPGGMDESQPRLFGYMRTDAQGRFAFKTIRPGHYPDQREPVEQHIHGEVTAQGFARREFRLGFQDDPFWKTQDKSPPRWALEVTRAADGVQHCATEFRLAKPNDEAQR